MYNQLNGASPKILELKSVEDGDMLIATFSKKMEVPVDLSTLTLTAQYEENINISLISGSLNTDDSTSLVFTLSDTVFAEYNLSLSYSGSNITSIDGGMLETFTDLQVSNNSIGMNFNVTSGQIETDGYTATLNFSKPLAIIVGRPDAFTMEVNGTSVNYKELHVLNNSIKFILGNSLHYGDSLVMSYTPGNITATDRGKLDAFNDLTFNNPLAKPTWHQIPGKIEAEEYAMQFGTSTENTGDTGGGLNVGWIDGGDWLEYAFKNNSSETQFEITFRVASTSEDAKFYYYIDNKRVGSLDVPFTEGWQTWESIQKKITINEGQHYLKIEVVNGGFNINYMDIALPAGINTNISAKNIAIYPNPVSSEMVISTGDFRHNKIEIVDVSGKIVHSISTKGETEIHLQVDLSNGLYFLKISNDQELLSKSIIIKNE